MSSSHLQHKPTIVLTNPVTGMSLRILTSAAESGGSRLEMEAFYAAGSAVPPPHFHPRQEERFVILEGGMRAVVGGVRVDLRNFLLAALVSLVSGSAFGQAAAPAPVLPDALAWFSPPGNPDLRAAWVLGTEKEAAPYVLRVRLAHGGRIPVHTHPDTRNSTVLSGTLYVGFGDSADDSKRVAVPAGALYVAPANVPHSLWARDGDVIYQEAGVGPTANTILVGGAGGEAGRAISESEQRR